jgi:endogenous inhibitor of DNA gyrase (YacG/DUF329 family)
VRIIFILYTLTREGFMEIIDRRTSDKMPEDERKRYEEDILKHLPDCSEKCESVDINLLMSKISLRDKQEKPPEDPQENS